MSRALLSILVSGHGHPSNAAIVTITLVWMIYDIQGVLTRWPDSSCGTVVSCSLVLAFFFGCPFNLLTAVKSQGGY